MIQFLIILLLWFIGFSMGAKFVLNSNPDILIKQFPMCVEKDFGKEKIKKCYDVKEVEN